MMKSKAFLLAVLAIVMTPGALSKFLGLPVDLPLTSQFKQGSHEALPLGEEVFFKLLSIHQTDILSLEERIQKYEVGGGVVKHWSLIQGRRKTPNLTCVCVISGW